MCFGDSYMYWGQLCVFGTAMCIVDSYVYWGQLCVLGTAMSIRLVVFVFLFVRVRSVSRYCFIRNYAAIPGQLEIVVLQYISWCVPIVWTFVCNQFSCFCQFLADNFCYSIMYYYYYYLRQREGRPECKIGHCPH